MPLMKWEKFDDIQSETIAEHWADELGEVGKITLEKANKQIARSNRQAKGSG